MDDILLKVNACLVPTFCEGNDRPCNESDFSIFQESNEDRVFELLKYFQNNINNSLSREAAVTTIILIGENYEKFFWNSNVTVKTCCSLLEYLLKLNRANTLNELLTENNGIKTYLLPILQTLRPKLLKDTWKLHPASVQCYSWILKNVPNPYLSDIVHDVLPTALLITDDHVDSNRLLGVSCLDHFIKNLTLADLKLHGIGELIYSIVEPLLRIREKELVGVLIPSVMLLVNRMHEDLLQKKNNHKWQRFDDVMDILLGVIEFEHLIDLRNIYIEQLLQVVKCNGDKVLRWYKRIIRIVDTYGENAAEEKNFATLATVLNIILSLLQLQGTKIYCSQQILCITFKILYFVGENQQTAAFAECRRLLYYCQRIIINNLNKTDKFQLEKDIQEYDFSHLLLLPPQNS